MTIHATSEKLIINLWKNADGRLFTKSVEIVDKVSRVRFSFNNDASLDDILVAEVVGHIDQIVEKTDARRGMLMMPDLLIDLKDLALQGCRVMFTAAENGAENIMIRFVEFFGRVTSLFKPGYVGRDSFSEDSVDQAVDALERIYMPLRNFSHFVDDILARVPHLLDSEQSALLGRVNSEIKSLSYFGDLVSHYVNSQGAITGGEITPLVQLTRKPDELLDAHLADERAGAPATA